MAVTVDLQVYSTTATLRAAYKFTDKWYVFLTRVPDQEDQLLAVFTPKDAGAHADGAVAGQFANELIDQRLREGLEQQFGQLRTLIVAEAFAEGNLLDADRDEGDYRADPRGAGRRR